jgi:membrane carboxypeptidase/penicillin-binding protein
MVKKLFFGILILLGAVMVYYTVVVLKARADTPGIVEEVLASGRIKLQLSDLSDRQRAILLTVQDPNFYHHRGVDMQTPGAGVTTLTQGLVKFYYFDEFKAGIPKIKQTLIARFAFDPLVPKERQLLMFINEVYLGHHHDKAVKGLEDGARYYYAKPFRDLSEAEYLGLVAMIRAPARFHVLKKPADNQERVIRIKKVLSGEYIPKDNSDFLYDR